MYIVTKEFDLIFDELLHNSFNPFIGSNKSILYICLKNEGDKTVCEKKMDFIHNALEQTVDMLYKCELDKVDISTIEQRINLGFYYVKLAIDKIQTQNKYTWIKRPADKEELTEDLIRYTLRCPKPTN